MADDGYYAGPLKVGGAIRFNYQQRSWGSTYNKAGEFTFDTARINLDLNTNNIISSLEYRYYRDKHMDGHDYNMLHHAYVGWKEEDWQVQAGVHQVPFGILPWASHNYFFQMPYYVGLEDDYDLGIKYIQDRGPWNLQIAYYIQDEGNWDGDSDDSARYSVDPVVEDGVGCEEEHQGNLRLAYTIDHSETHSTELGTSLQFGGLRNGNSGGNDGYQYAAALHINENYEQWNLMLEAIRYEFCIEDDGDGNDDYILMGSYDAPYQVAAAGNIYSAGLAYTLPVEWGPVSALTFYDDISMLDKDERDFADSYQNVAGCAVTAGRFYIYIDWAMGKNQPWLGPNWTEGLSAGGDNSWETRFNVNVGYYF